MTIRAFSDVLQDIDSKLQGERITVSALNSALHERGLGVLLFLFSLPAALPLPGLGINTVIALPLLLLTGHLVIGRHKIWLPHFMREKTFSTPTLKKAIAKIMPLCQKGEILVRPRLSFLTQQPASILVGLIAFVMAVYVAIPLPLTNTIPSFGLALIGIGLTMRDGLLIIGGLLVGLCWISFLTFAIVFIGAEASDLIRAFLAEHF